MLELLSSFPIPFVVYFTAIEVRRELVSRNLEGDHKIIKFIENCIKSVDGWRFKKSAPTSRPTDSGSASAAGNSLAAPAKLENLLNDDMLPYPMRFVLFGELPKEKLSGSDKESHKETRNKQQHHQRQQSWTVSSQPLSQSRQELQSEGQYLGFSE